MAGYVGLEWPSGCPTVAAQADYGCDIYVQVTGVNGEDGPVCEPDCADKQCGGDGCGGNCGICGTEESCIGGACVAEAADADIDGDPDSTDCAPNDGSIYHGAAEVCDGIDNDCDEQVDEDLESNNTILSVGICAQAYEVCLGVAGWVMNYPVTYEFVEISCDGLDNDCDGLTDENCIDCNALNCDDGNTCTTDSCDINIGCLHNPNSEPCSDGVYCNGPDVCSGGTCSIHGGNPCAGQNVGPDCSDSCNESSDDCTASDADGTSCTGGLCQSGDCELSCVPATEICDNKDNDCDGQIDEGLDQPSVCGIGACQRNGTNMCMNGQYINTCFPGLPITEICGNTIDDDCDGVADEDCDDSCTTADDCDDSNSCTSDQCTANHECLNLDRGVLECIQLGGSGSCTGGVVTCSGGSPVLCPNGCNDNNSSTYDYCDNAGQCLHYTYPGAGFHICFPSWGGGQVCFP